MDDDNNFFKIIDDDGEPNVVDVEANELTHTEEVKPEPEEAEEIKQKLRRNKEVINNGHVSKKKNQSRKEK